jgi:Transport protein Trs120 or TRAPPC9, TRAPP II complex subunit
MDPASFILPAHSCHTHTIQFKPREPGGLSVKGCVIKFSVCKTAEFPLLRERSGRERDSWYDMRGGEFKVKRVGIEAVLVETWREQLADHAQESPLVAWSVNADVVPPKPFLVLEACSMANRSIMLLEGEQYHRL